MTIAMPRPLEPEDRIPAAWVCAAIEVAGQTQTGLAEKLHMTVVAVNRWCRGRVPVSTARWAAIKAVLGLPPDWQPPGSRGE